MNPQFQLYYPIQPAKLSQGFGVNGAYYQAHGINIVGHNGLDYWTYHGQPIYAAHNGTAYYEVDSSAGHGIVLVSDKMYPANFDDPNYGHITECYYKTIYWHLVDSNIEPQFKSPVEAFTDLTKPGMKVRAGDLIGYADNTGFSTGDHLHFGFKRSNLVYPEDFQTYNRNNGYLGAIDPTPFFNGEYACNLSKPKYTFNTNLYKYDQSNDVVQLQKCLQWLGLFPITTQLTGYFGEVTRKAAYAFQLKYVAPQSVWAKTQVLISRGGSVASLTRKALNTIFS